MGLCCMVLTDDGSGGRETKVEGKEIAAVFKGHPAESSLVSKKENGPANWLRMLRSKAG